MEFVFKNVDTSRITGKPTPCISKWICIRGLRWQYSKQRKEVVKGNKNTGFSNNQAIIDFIDDLYNDYNIYDNYIKFYYKSFISPLSKTGIHNYNYYLTDKPT